MNHPAPLRRRAGALLATAGLAAAGLVALAVPSATAAVTGEPDEGTLSWGISTYINSAQGGRPNPYPVGYGAPASFDAGTRTSSWSEPSGELALDGSLDLTYSGTSVNYAPTSGSWLKIAAPEVDIDSDGNGTMSALVSYGMAAGGNPVPYDDSPGTVVRAAQRITVMTLTGNTAADGAVDEDGAGWTGLDGAWAPAFIDFLDGDVASSVAPWPYHVTFTGAADRLALPITLDVERAEPALTYTTGSAGYGDGLTLNVSGDGFRGVTNVGPPADNGVYVGLAQGSVLPDVSSMAGMSAFVATQWVTKDQIVDGAFSTVLSAPTAKLDPTKSYSIFTWQAHSHSNPTQDTVTPVTIDWSALQPKASAVTTGGATGTAYGATAVVTAAVPGKGTVTLSGLGDAQKVTLAAPGTASFTVPAGLAAGSYTATFAYSGGGDYTGAQATKQFVVSKAATKTDVVVKPKPTARKAGKATVTGPAGAKVAVVVKHGRKTVRKATVTLGATGTGTVRLAKAPKGGSFVVMATYAGDANHAASSDKATYRVKKLTKARKK